jgi:hypothetical protein
MQINIIENIFTNYCEFVEILNKNKKWKIQQKWRECFSFNLKEQTGKWIINGTDWHTFSYHYSICLKGIKAEDAFTQCSVNQFYCISSNNFLNSIHCNNGRLPNSQVIKKILIDNPDIGDLYFIPDDFKWTMVFVHEFGVGPFFFLY